MVFKGGKQEGNIQLGFIIPLAGQPPFLNRQKKLTASERGEMPNGNELDHGTINGITK